MPRVERGAAACARGFEHITFGLTFFLTMLLELIVILLEKKMKCGCFMIVPAELAAVVVLEEVVMARCTGTNNSSEFCNIMLKKNQQADVVHLGVVGAVHDGGVEDLRVLLSGAGRTGARGGYCM